MSAPRWRGSPATSCSLGTGAEQEVIEDLLVLQRQWGELVRESEDHMDIGNRQKFVLTSHNPLVASAALTLGAMAITTTVIRGGAIATARALITMSNECRHAAASDGAQYFPVGPVDPAEVVLNQAIALGTNNIGQLEEGPSHFFFRLRERWMPSRLETLQRIERIGDGLQMLGREMHPSYRKNLRSHRPRFCGVFHQPPDKLGPEQIRQYQAHLFQGKKFAPARVSQYVSALRRRSSSSIFLRSWVTGTSFFRDPTYLKPSTTADPRTRGSVRRASGFVQIAITLNEGF